METPLQIFKQEIENLSIYAVSGESFVLVGRLNTWLNSTVDNGPRTVLENLYNTTTASGTVNTPPWKSDSVLLFCILLELGITHILEEFITNGISDKSLPVEEHRVCSLFQDLSPEEKKLTKQFFEMQWKYCPAIFDLNGNSEWPQEMVIPICSQNLIAQGRTAKVYEVTIPEEFIGQNLARNFPHCRLYLDADFNVCPGWYYRFALKKLDKWNTDLGKREIAACQEMGSHEGLVRPLVAFHTSQIPFSGTEKSEESYNIIFEYCETDLSSYYASRNPPVTPGDIALFWTNISTVVQALCYLHGAPQDTTSSKSETSVKDFGYHHDIKPSNILLSEGHFKLSDFGFASFGPLNKAKISPSASFGTVSYGPPAPNMYESTDRTLESFQKFDLWSLGCVLSEAATWVILGNPGIKTYSALRRKVLDKLCTEHERVKPEVDSNEIMNKPRRGDYFHDGSNVLASVTAWHQFLWKSVRRSDLITCEVLDIIDQGLLVSDIRTRFNASTLYQRLKDIVSKGEKEGCLLPGAITNLYIFIEEEWNKITEEDSEEEYK